MDLSIEQAQRRFSELHGGLPKQSSRLQEWLEELLGVPVRHYGTSSQPGKQLKNRLGQAADKGMNSLVFFSVEEHNHEAALASLANSWAERSWNQQPATVALVVNDGERWTVRDAVSLRPSVGHVSRIKECLFPEVRETEIEVGDATPSLFEFTSADDFSDLAEDLCVSEGWLEDTCKSLTDLRGKRAVVFYGPPGTGKTYIARKIAAFLQPRSELRSLVQLHPSYGYEQFFEGYRPAPGKSGLSLEKQPGPLRRLVDRMKPGDRGILILDEMNRGNLPRVFGELYYLLEYRDESVELMYAEPREDGTIDEFRLPEGFLLIGTMNTADRSVALLDQALKRRFHFVPLFPDRPPLAPSAEHRGVLRTFLQVRSSDLHWLPEALDRLNEELGDRDASIGPSHFLGLHELTEDSVERVWEHTILPMIEDRLRGSRRSLDEFRLAAIRADLG